MSNSEYPIRIVAEVKGKRNYLKNRKYPTLARPSRIPCINFSEECLRKAGFPVGTTVNIEISENKVVITPVVPFVAERGGVYCEYKPGNYPGNGSKVRVGAV